MTAHYSINNNLFNHLPEVGPLSFPQFFTITKNAIFFIISSILFTKSGITGSRKLFKVLKAFFLYTI